MTNNPRPCPSRSATASQRIDTQTMRSCTRGDALQAVRRGHLQVAVAPDVARINNLLRILCIVRRVEPTWVVHLIFGATCAPILEYMHMSHESPFCKLLLVQSAKKHIESRRASPLANAHQPKRPLASSSEIVCNGRVAVCGRSRALQLRETPSPSHESGLGNAGDGAEPPPPVSDSMERNYKSNKQHQSAN